MRIWGLLRCRSSRDTLWCSSGRRLRRLRRMGWTMRKRVRRGAYAEFAPARARGGRGAGGDFVHQRGAGAGESAKEIPEWDFAGVQRRAAGEVGGEARGLRWSGATDEERKDGSTRRLYHALLYPRIFSEYGRYYSAFDDTIHDWRELYGLFDLGHVSRGEQHADAAGSGARGRDGHGAAAELSARAAGCRSGRIRGTRTS